jgi:hypothetical protein
MLGMSTFEFSDWMLVAIIALQVIQTTVLLAYMIYKEGTDRVRADMVLHMVAPMHRVVCYQDSILYQGIPNGEKRNTAQTRNQPPASN